MRLTVSTAAVGSVVALVGFAGAANASATINSAFLNNGDFDGDGVADLLDNCSEAANPAQDDTDLDFCGNKCDADYDQDGIVGGADFGWFGQAWLTNDEVHCHTGIIPGCVVGGANFGFFEAHWLGTPGPSGTTPGTVACPL